MRKLLSWASATLLVAAIPVCALAMQDEGKKVEKAAGAEVGKPAPDFTLTDTAGTEHKLSSLKGKIVVLEWTNHECPYVVRHQKNDKTMQKLADKYKQQNVVWLAINSSHFAKDKLEAIQKWQKDNDVTFPILIDETGATGKAYGAKTTPHMFVIDAKGTLAYAGAIDDNPDGTKKEAKNYVEEAITALLKDSTVATTTTKPYGCSVKYMDKGGK
jgi:peroxiredoxin